MNSPLELYRRASALGLTVEADGQFLVVRPRSKCPPDFAAVLRHHKRELLDWLEARTYQLRPDELPWVHVAKQVLGGEFDGMDSTTRESLRIGLRSINHPLCKQALAKLKHP
jgi:hypothetical protein